MSIFMISTPIFLKTKNTKWFIFLTFPIFPKINWLANGGALHCRSMFRSCHVGTHKTMHIYMILYYVIRFYMILYDCIWFYVSLYDCIWFCMIVYDIWSSSRTCEVWQSPRRRSRKFQNFDVWRFFNKMIWFMMVVAKTCRLDSDSASQSWLCLKKKTKKLRIKPKKRRQSGAVL